MKILFIWFIPFFLVHCLGHLQKFDTHLTKLENGEIRFQYVIQTAQPLWMQIEIYESKRVENNHEENVKKLNQNTLFGKSLSGFFEILHKPGMSYTFKIIIANDEPFNDILKSWHEIIGYKYLSKKALTRLMNNAIKNLYNGYSNGGDFVQFFRRTKDSAYWDKVQRDGAIETFFRDGEKEHPSPINYSYGSIPFFAVPKDITYSPFGNKKIDLYPYEVLGNNPLEEFAYYFADIKCYGGPTHYLTIAVSRIGSVEDNYCKEHLIKLSPIANRFFKIQQNASRSWDFIVYKWNRVWIEIVLMNRLIVNPIVPKDVRTGRKNASTGTSSSKVINQHCPVCSMRNFGFPVNFQQDDAAVSVPSDQTSSTTSGKRKQHP